MQDGIENAGNPSDSGINLEDSPEGQPETAKVGEAATFRQALESLRAAISRATIRK
jgi:hypothetical protein